jgi:hypothetical protein
MPENPTPDKKPDNKPTIGEYVVIFLLGLLVWWFMLCGGCPSFPRHPLNR